MTIQAKLFLAVCLLLLPACCATDPLITGEETVIIRDVPFFSQEAYQCGPAALATVLDYWYQKTDVNKRLTPEQITSEIYSPTAKGVLGIDLEIYGRRQGFTARQYSGSISDLRQHIDESMPVVVLVDYGLSSLQANHFMVVTGYTADGVIVNSGRREGHRISNREMEKIWRRTGHWSLVLSPLSSQSWP
jgi:predicted double-glycine peptidase